MKHILVLFPMAAFPIGAFPIGTLLIGAVLIAGGASAQSSSTRPAGLYAIFHTSAGAIAARLFEKETPTTVRNFVALAQGKKPWRDPATRTMVTRPLYENITFFRVTPGIMIQAGDPTGKNGFNCGITIPDEILPGLRFDSGGKLALANSGNPDSGGCQFFITADAMTQWNGKYAIFGQVVEGREVVSKIAHARVIDEKPVDPVKLIDVAIERAGPEPKSKR
jgi:peptidyl-prolyl cis-trans isomerase A (cyclophilin A)